MAERFLTGLISSIPISLNAIEKQNGRTAFTMRPFKLGI
jgi:hypothetical protein